MIDILTYQKKYCVFISIKINIDPIELFISHFFIYSYSLSKKILKQDFVFKESQVPIKRLWAKCI